MWDRVMFKSQGRTRFKANYWPYVAVSLVLALVGGGLLSYASVRVNEAVQNGWIHLDPATAAVLHRVLTLSIPFILASGILGLVFTFLVGNPFEMGASRFFLENDGVQRPSFSRVGFGFTANYGNVILTMLLRDVFTFLWALLLIIPGIIRAYGYFAVPFILAENPGMDNSRALKLSLDMTQGHKWDIFVTHLSFLGWMILSAFTANILGIFYVYPYMNATNAEMYRWLRQEALRTGVAAPGELPGTEGTIYQG